MDGVTVPDDPEKMLAEGRVISSLKGAAFGAQSLDGFLHMYVLAS